MTPPTPPPLDIVAVMVVIAGLLFSPRVAAIVGPYSVIIASAVLGGAVSAASRPKDQRTGTASYMVMVTTLSILVTVPLAEFAASHARVDEPQKLFGLVSALISGVGYRWPRILGHVFEFGRSVLSRRYGGPPNDPPGGRP